MLSYVKAFMRIDFTDDDALITSLIAMSLAFIKNATGITIVETTTDDLEKVTVAMTVYHFYENRESFVSTGAVPKALPMTVQSLYAQLQRKKDAIDNATP